MALDITVQLLIESNGGVKQWNDGDRFLPREKKKSSSVEQQKKGMNLSKIQVHNIV